MERLTAANLEELQTAARRVLAALQASDHATVIGLSGELGAGKTAFVKALARELGVREEVTSPTFVVMKTYDVPNHPRYSMLTHIDAYRIESDDEMRVLGFKDIVEDASRLVAIEWPEKIATIMPAYALPVALTIVDGTTREITYDT